VDYSRFWAFCSGAVEVFILQRNCAMLLGDFYTKFLPNMIVLPSRALTPLEVGHLNP